jgi:arylsulfatase A-like enzyme
MKFHGKNLFPDHFRNRIQNREYDRMTPEQRKEWDAFYGPENQAFIKQMNAGKLSDDDVVRWKYQRYMGDYLGCLASVDEGVGRLLDYLDQQGLADNTIVVYTSDQGFFLGDDGLYDKRYMYEPSLRMPLLIRWPGRIKQRSVCDAMVLNLDFAPTFLQSTGCPVPGNIQGESFLSIMQGERPSGWRRAMYYHYYEHPSIASVRRHYGIRTDRYKLIHFYYDMDGWELYDLQKDPCELNNLYDVPEYAGLVSQLKTQLEQLRSRYGDSDELAQRFIEEKLESRNKR